MFKIYIYDNIAFQNSLSTKDIMNTFEMCSLSKDTNQFEANPTKRRQSAEWAKGSQRLHWCCNPRSWDVWTFWSSTCILSFYTTSTCFLNEWRRSIYPSSSWPFVNQTCCIATKTHAYPSSQNCLNLPCLWWTYLRYWKPPCFFENLNHFSWHLLYSWIHWECWVSLH